MPNTLFENLLNAPAEDDPGPLTPEVADRLGDIGDRITSILNRDARPSLGDISTALLRNAAGTQTFGEALSGIQSQRRQRAVQDVELGLQGVNAMLQQNELLARQGHPQARALKRAMAVTGFDRLDPDRKARVIQNLEALPEEVDPTNALSLLSRAMQETAPFEPPEIVETIEGESRIQQIYDPASGELLDTKISPLFKPESDRPQVFNLGDTIVDEHGNVIFREEPSAASVTPRTDIAKLRADLQNGLITQDEFDQEIARLDTGGGATPAQTANNAEIDAARRFIRSRGESFDEIVKQTQQFGEFGLPNPDYNAIISRQLTTAMQRKVGDDPDFETFRAEMFGEAAPEDALDLLMPGAASGGAGAPAALPTTADGSVDASRLQVDRVYATPEGERFRWTGSAFVPVQ